MTADRLTIAQRRKLHQLCWEFEDAWRAGSARLEDWLEKSSVDHDATLQELLATEIELRQSCLTLADTLTKSSDPTISTSTDDVSIDEYLTRFPQHAAVVRAAFASASQTSQSDASPFAKLDDDGRYEFIHEIARGGAGAVWRVFDRHLQRESAIKVLLTQQNSNEMRRRLENEARLCGRLQHPGIVPVHELEWFDNGQPFVSMRLIEGHTLAELLSAKTIDRQAALRYFQLVCEAVAYAHQKGIIHRDLKPSNVMVGAFGEVQVMDWGLAKEIGSGEQDEIRFANEHAVKQLARNTIDPNTTATGTVLGTPAYMSPEQARGQTEKLDYRCDVFSLGAILCKILTGSSPYAPDSDDTPLLQSAGTAKLDSAYTRLRAVDADPRLIQIALECLALEPGDRPANAGQIVARLRTLEQGRGFSKRIVFATTALCLLIGLPLLIAGAAAIGKRDPDPLIQPTTPVPAASTDLRSMWQTADSLLIDNKFDDALPIYQQILVAEPDSARANYFLSHCMFETARFVEAADLLSRAEHLTEGDPPLDVVHRHKDKYKQLAEIQRNFPGSIVVREECPAAESLVLADFCNRVGLIEPAIAHYRHAFSRRGELPEETLYESRYQSVIFFACRHLSRPEVSEEQRQLLCEFSLEMLDRHMDDALRLKREGISKPVAWKYLVGLLVDDSTLEPLRKALQDPSIDASIRQSLEAIFHEATIAFKDEN
ncbi:protein kinase domain-containing protein [Stieleria varia]|uniref:Serine/threonine-protein kinase PknD n=1 Tax=Stieleria varia TaxID=2528005 RepID=A0A5C6A004_9BACT|nr:protein kinase [Stieleria varia]TWT92736.1 Serine/threonine-protein kinase PknD [Stieleria varia]